MKLFDLMKTWHWTHFWNRTFILHSVLCYVSGLQQEYTNQTGAYKLFKNLLALPLLPAEHMIPAFQGLTGNILDETTLKLVSYVQSTWLQNATWSVFDISVFKQTIRTNNDLEGWHRRLNVRARNGNLPLYVLIKLLHMEASNAGLQVVLLSEGRIKRNTRRKYREINERLNTMWAKYEAGEMTTTRLLRHAARLQLPFYWEQAELVFTFCLARKNLNNFHWFPFLLLTGAAIFWNILVYNIRIKLVCINL